MDVSATAVSGSVQEFGCAGAANTHLRVDPVEDLIGLFMTQLMVAVDNPQNGLRAVAYQAIDD